MLPTFLVAAAEGATSWSISGLLGDVSTIFSSVGSLIMENIVASAFVGMSLVGGGVGLFRKVIHTR